jgi:hypothetical protein
MTQIYNEEVDISDAEVAARLAAQAAANDAGLDTSVLGVAAPEGYDPLDNEAVNKAAEVFGNSIPRIKAIAKNLKGGALYRVFAATMEFPLQDKEPKFLSKVENELFILCLSSVMAKSTMLQAMAADQARKRKAEAATEAALVAPVTDDVLVNKQAEMQTEENV